MLFSFFSSLLPSVSSFFFFNDTATTEIYTLSLHDALPIFWWVVHVLDVFTVLFGIVAVILYLQETRESHQEKERRPDRKSTRLNSSHSQISYAVFCLKKKKN